MTLPVNGLVNKQEDFAQILEHLERVKRVTVDHETTGLDFTRDLIAGTAIKTEVGKWYCSFRHHEGTNLDPDGIKILGDLCHSRQEVRGYNYKFDTEFWTVDGVAPPPLGTIRDPIYAGQLLDENTRHKLEIRGQLYNLGTDDDEKTLIDEIVSRFGGKRDDAKGKLFFLDGAKVAPYACNDVELTDRLHDFYLPYLKHYELYNIWLEVCEYAESCTRMELNGLSIDPDYCEAQISTIADKMMDVKQKIYGFAGAEINLNSNPQVQRWLKMPSTAKDKLQDILIAHPDREDINALLTYRFLKTATDTYFQAYLDAATAETKIHPNLNLCGTVTGRPSCPKPNLLNVPRNSAIYAVRNAFVASPGHTIIEWDLSQAEMRVGAHYAQEKRMMELLRDPKADAHGDTAARMKCDRDIAKRVNFSYLFGIGYKTFAEKYHVSESAAQKYLTDYGRVYPNFRRLLEETRRQAKRDGFIRMWTGRMIHYNCLHEFCHCEVPKNSPRIHGKATKMSAHPAESCSNLIQGGVSEMIRIGIVNMTKNMPWARLLLTIYDSVIAEVPDDRLEEALKLGHKLLLDNKSGIHMMADAKYGKRWGQLQKAT